MISRLIIFGLLILVDLPCRYFAGNDNFQSPGIDTIMPYINPSNSIEKILEAECTAKSRGYRIPGNPEDLKLMKASIREEIIKNACIKFYPGLDPDMKQTGDVKLKGYSVKNIYFQTRPGIYATANLYVPDGKGPFPGIVHMIGHFGSGKIGRNDPQGVGHALALSGYVCISIDPWGYGERTTIHGNFENHGSNLGASLLNIGETLMGMQVTDNIRAVDLLCSLSYVDPGKIGATGASGGGHQTLYLAALDDRIKACVPVVSIGTYESLCSRGCICNMLLNGLTFTEEAGVLALICPRAVKIINHNMDSSPAFYPKEMLRTFNDVRPAFRISGVEENISYQLFDLVHGYKREDREAAIGWFDLHLKGIGDGNPVGENIFEFLSPDSLMVFEKGRRNASIITTQEYCISKGQELRKVYTDTKHFDAGKKRSELKEILGLSDEPEIRNATKIAQGRYWKSFILESGRGLQIPLLLLFPENKSGKVTVLCSVKGSDGIDPRLIQKYIDEGSILALTDLSGTGRTVAKKGSDYRTIQIILARSQMWMGKTTIGQWISEMDMVLKFLSNEIKFTTLAIDADKEAGIAALMLSAINGKPDLLILRNIPLSYQFDERKNVDFYSMGIHIPGLLKWGDISLAAALTGKEVRMIEPLTMSGNQVRSIDYVSEFANAGKLVRKGGKTIFY